MKKLFLGFIITTVLISQAFAQSSTGTEGGGGVYKTSTGQYVTLPEMGLLIGEKVERGTKTYSHYYTISPNTLSEINNIIETVNSVMGSNLLKYYVDEYLDRRENIIKIKDVKSEIYKKIKEEYQSVLQKYGYTLENEKFVLPAYTVPGHYVKKDEYSKEKIYIPGKTYILPDFELLTEKQQAKIIIHEVNMERPRIYTKSKEEKLEDVLAVDVQINQMLNDSSKVDWLTALTHFYKAELSRDVTEFVLLALQKSLAHPIYQDDIIMKGRYFSDNMYHDNMWRIIDSLILPNKTDS